jgi:hypothetical protein
LENAFSRSLYDANTRNFAGKECHDLSSCDIFKAAVAFEVNAITATSAAMQRHSMQLFFHIKCGWLVLTPTPQDTKSSSHAGQIPSVVVWY